MKTLPSFFSANAVVGRELTAQTDFPTCADLLRHMDRIGVDRCLVYSAEARDYLPSYGNDRLLKEIASLDKDWKRLVPSLVVGPCMLYDRGALDELKGILREGRVRALRAFPSNLRYRLHHLEPLLEQILECKPALFVDMRQVASDSDIAQLARRFPDLPIVCMYAMWGNIFFSLLDLLRRCPNVLADTSWMHTEGTTRRIVEDYGPDRLLFGIGRKSHAGAAMAGLMHAQISAEDREAIAHGNLDRLLGLDQTAAVAQAGAQPQEQALWKPFLQGTPPPVDIVDAHGHFGSLGRWPMEPPHIQEQVPFALKRMDQVGIRTFIASGEKPLFADPIEGHLEMERVVGDCGDRIRGYLGFHPAFSDELGARLDEFFGRPFFAGFKFLCDYWLIPVTDKRFEIAYAYADEHRLPILLHTWSGKYDGPAMLKDIVRTYPNAFFLLGHSGGGDEGRREAEELAGANRNVYLEWCGSFCSALPWEETFRRLGSDQIVFGTDGVLHDMAWELGRMLSLDLPQETILPALGANMRRILAARR